MTKALTRDMAVRIADAPWCYSSADISDCIRGLLGTPPRSSLPHRRPSVTLDRGLHGHIFSITLGFDPATGAVREVFADTDKGGQMQAILADACVLISIALQHGIPAEALAKSLAREPDRANGEDEMLAASPIGVLLDTILAEGRPPPEIDALPVAPAPHPVSGGAHAD